MVSSFTRSAACCSAPAVIGPQYSHLGEFVEVDSMRTYVSGHKDATKALFVIYDVFGYSSQILQGADLLAARGYRVFMPDFFEGEPAPLEWMPMPDDAGKEASPNDAALTDFCNGPGNTERTIDRVFELRIALQNSTASSVQSWGLVGYCWGGYVANYALGANSPFQACAELHPGFPGQEIAEKIARPLLALCSKDEPETEYAHFKPHVKVEAKFVHFPEMVHGWMSARGDLGRPEVKHQFQRGYEMLAEWFDQRL